jgi:hypothetical protein
MPPGPRPLSERQGHDDPNRGEFHVRAGRIDPSMIPPQPQPQQQQQTQAAQATVPLLDDDAGVCTTISPYGLAHWWGQPYRADYVDNVDYIVEFRPSDPWGFSGIENDPVTVRLANGMNFVFRRNWVTGDLNAASQYRKHGGIIVPADAAGNYMLNQMNTPNLVWIDNFILALTKRAAHERCQLAMITYSFSQAVSALGHASKDDLESKVDGLEKILDELGADRSGLCQ